MRIRFEFDFYCFFLAFAFVLFVIAPTIDFIAVMSGLFVGMLFSLISSAIRYYSINNRIYVYSGEGWLDINEHPFPHDRCKALITDGEEITYNIMSDYKRHGTMIMNRYERRPITHWMPYPDLPKKEKK